MVLRLDEEYTEHWLAHRETIRRRLDEFVAVPPEEYLYELYFCLLTPQSRAAHAEQVIARLRTEGFPERPVDVVAVLRDPRHYIRFHNQKALRLAEAAARSDEILAALTDQAIDAASKREWLVANVKGLGWKEASHFLRNIGHLDLAIIDRHILKHMLRTGAIDAIPASVGSRRAYVELERRFAALAAGSGLSLQELDLLFWSFEEGSVRK
ncbi:MAG TPA: DNA lyase [Candidatus Kapabacteria bacterium]|nr:DNA lyase [Candidatus Kapabacteria bacterium]